MKALIVGLGSIGRRHLANLRSLEPGASITVWHQRSLPQDGARAAGVADREVYRIEDALDPLPDVAVIATPASLHVETAHALAQEGVHLFIEKPLSHTPDGVDGLLALCRGRGLVLMVGYQFRFCPSLQVVRQMVVEERIGRVLSCRAEVGQFLPDWRPGQPYSESVSARNDLGGGVVLELSHELDYVRWLLGEVESVSAWTARLSDLQVDVEDTAEVLLRFHSGALGSVHLDMVQRAPVRTCRIVGSEGTLVWDGLSHRVALFSTLDGQWREVHPACATDRNEMYLAEMRHFLECVREGKTPQVTGEDGRRVLEMALAAKQSSQEQRVVRL